MKIFSFDAETNGLWGAAFALSAAVYQDSKLAASFTAYLGSEGVTDGWVRDNVLPKLADLAKTHDTLDSMLSAFADFYKANKDGADIIAHIGVPVEAKVLLDMHQKGFIGDWDGPYPFLDVASVLKARGYDPTSVDKYNERHGLLAGRSEAEGLATHHPLYDSIAAAVAYMHLMGLGVATPASAQSDSWEAEKSRLNEEMRKATPARAEEIRQRIAWTEEALRKYGG